MSTKKTPPWAIDDEPIYGLALEAKEKLEAAMALAALLVATLEDEGIDDLNNNGTRLRAAHFEVHRDIMAILENELPEIVKSRNGRHRACRPPATTTIP